METMVLSYNEIKQDIRERAGQIVQNFVVIGCRLKEVEDKEMYLVDGYKDLNEFAKKEFRMDKTAVSRFIRVYEKFAEGGYNPKLKKEYEELAYSQLSEMLTIGENDYEMITKDTTVKQIRELKKFNKMEQAEISKEVQVQDLSEWQKVIIEFFRIEENKEVLDFIFRETEVSEELVEQLNPGGTRTFRKGIYFFMFYDLDTGIKYKKMMDTNIYQMSYSEFVENVMFIFKDYEKDGKVWANYYSILEKKQDIKKIENATSQMKEPEQKHTDKQSVEIRNVEPKIKVDTQKQEEERQQVENTERSEEQIEGQIEIEEYLETIQECKVCKEGVGFAFDIKEQTLEIKIEKSELVISLEDHNIRIPIEYCPKCGKKIKSEDERH